MWDILSVLCRRGPGPPEVCLADLMEGLHKSWAGSFPPPGQHLGLLALAPLGPLLLQPFFFPPWASRSPPVTSRWRGGTHRWLGERAGLPSSHREGIPPHQGFPRRSWSKNVKQWVKETLCFANHSLVARRLSIEPRPQNFNHFQLNTEISRKLITKTQLTVDFFPSLVFVINRIIDYLFAFMSDPPSFFLDAAAWNSVTFETHGKGPHVDSFGLRGHRPGLHRCLKCW